MTLKLEMAQSLRIPFVEGWDRKWVISIMASRCCFGGALVGKHCLVGDIVFQKMKGLELVLGS